MLNIVHPDNLHDAWKEVKAGVEAVAKTHDHWIPEDLYTAIKTGRVLLYVYKDPDYRGFLALQEQSNESGKSLHVWAGYSNAHDFDLLEASTAQLKEWAEQVNANAITFSTTRKGWARKALKLGFKPDLITYRLKL